MSLIDRLTEWFRKRFCPHKHLVPRLRWVEEFVDYYDECADCGREFYAD